MNKYYSYVRVSTIKQGEQGVSLQQQRDAIDRFAHEKCLTVVERFEEQETAAKRGRPVFTKMVRQLKLGQASGVIMHKIDRSARNLRDWADLGDLIDAGVQVHFSNESIDMNSRGGRLSADIQAVIASDFIRNLREETKKGFYGRLKQGLYPLPAPIGYLNIGKGKRKEIDPVRGPLIRQVFELYATGRYNIPALVQEMGRRGLRSMGGGKIPYNPIWKMLRNPFYTGLIVIKKNKESYVGQHQPLVPRALFEQVQQLLKRRLVRTTKKNDNLFPRLFSCKRCGKCIIPENHEKYVYYRCHTSACRFKMIREEKLEQAVVQQLKKLELSQEEKDVVRRHLTVLSQNSIQEQQQATKALEVQLGQAKDRENKIANSYIDSTIDEDFFKERITALRMERCEIENRLRELREVPASMTERTAQFVELAGSAYVAYRSGSPSEKRELLRTIGSNFSLESGSPMFMLAKPFSLIANRFEFSIGSPTGN